MALVSSSLGLSTSTGSFSGTPPFSRSSSDPPTQIRALPQVPTTGHQSGSTGARRSPSGGAHGQNPSGGAGAGTGGGGASYGRPLPTPNPGSSRSPSAPPFVELSSSRSVSPLPPPTVRSTTPSRGSGPSSSPAPYPHHHPQHRHNTSSSSSSLPRLPPVHLASGPTSAPPVPNGSHGYPHPHHQHPSFVASQGGGGPGHFPPGPPHAFPHPQYPFIPSPHPQAQQGGYQPGPYSPGFSVHGAANAEHQARLVQQAQLQQQQWQMEMMRQQAGGGQGQFDWGQPQQQQQGQARRRATSGPAPPNHSPTYYTTPLPYPPSPSPSLHHQHLYGAPAGAPSFPPGAMLPSFNGGYPTPPGSIEGNSGATNGGGVGSGVPNGREPFHPYRRGGKGDDGPTSHQQQRSTSQPGSRPHASTAMGHSPSASSSSSKGVHVRSRVDSSEFPPLPTKPTATASALPSGLVAGASTPSSSVGSVSPSLYASSSSAKNSSSSLPSSARSTPPPPPLPSNNPLPHIRTRTESQQSSHSVASSSRHHSPAQSISSGRGTDSFDSHRSATTPTASSFPVNKKPSPLSRPSQDGTVGRRSEEFERERPGTPGTLRGDEAGEESDDTAGGRAETKKAKGIKGRWKKAFGGGASSTNLTESELDGLHGPRGVQHLARHRADSVSSSESGTPHTPPSIVHAPGASSSSAASTSSTRRPPKTSRFGLLNPKLNSSTDNISISSTVSSASVMIRKLGQMGKLARRNSLMSLTKAFKKSDKGDGGDDKVDGNNKKDKKKSQAAQANVSHVTAEVESTPANLRGMSPAAALAKKHQQQYAEQEAAAAAAAAEVERLKPPTRSFVQHARTESDASSVKSGKSGWGRSTEDSTNGSNNKRGMLEKEKERLKSKKTGGRKWGLGFGSKDAAETGSINEDHHQPATASSSGAYGDGQGGRGGGYAEDGEAREVLASGIPYAAYGATYVEQEAGDSLGEDEYEPSLHENGHRRDAKAVRGILKGAGTYNQEDFSPNKPNFPRQRASSFDAPQPPASPTVHPPNALVNSIPSGAKVDGLVPSSSTSSPSSSSPHPIPRTDSPLSDHTNAPYSNPSANVSAPVLSHFGTNTSLNPLRSASAPGGNGRRIAFAQNLSVHTTWPAAVYDRRAEPATCNRLTPSLAQQIKEELNSFKMEEMDVHPSSRQLTHFFV